MTVITKAHRWLDLVVFLLLHRLPVSVEQIMENIPVYAGDWATENETKRDKDDLRGIGIPIETVPYTVEGEETQGTAFGMPTSTCCAW